MSKTPFLSLAVAFLGLAIFTTLSPADPAAPTFTGAKSAWHGFDRYDFMMDDAGVLTPTQATLEEGDGFRHREGSQRRCIIVIPRVAAPGNPWSWRGCYWDHQPQTEVELLKRGFCIGYVESGPDLRPDKSWDAWYTFLTQQHGLSPKPAFVGMSRGGEFSYTWAVRHPEQVSCIYADNPGGNYEVMFNLGRLATNDVPVLHVCGSIDPILGVFTLPMEDIYHQFGGRISLVIKEGRAHHPHSLRDPKFIADFIEQSVKETKTPAPDYAGNRFSKSAFYSLASQYVAMPSENTYVTERGPLFTPCYDRYRLELPHVESFTTVIAPKNPAPGRPWVFRADLVDREDAVAQALLAKGYYIVTVAVPYNADGPTLAQWNTVYQHFVDHGFAAKPVLVGAGGAAGEAYAWAIQNPEKVAGIYAENPVLHSNVAQTQPLGHLAPLAQAGIPILHICGSNDPWLEQNTRAAQAEYEKLGGKMQVIVVDGQGHIPSLRQDPQTAVDFVLGAGAK